MLSSANCLIWFCTTPYKIDLPQSHLLQSPWFHCNSQTTKHAPVLGLLNLNSSFYLQHLPSIYLHGQLFHSFIALLKTLTEMPVLLTVRNTVFTHHCYQHHYIATTITTMTATILFHPYPTLYSPLHLLSSHFFIFYWPSSLPRM